jgi:hypothetical protein
MMVHFCNPSCLGDVHCRIEVQGLPRHKNTSPCLKKQLSRNCKALSSIPSTAKKKKKKVRTA